MVEVRCGWKRGFEVVEVRTGREMGLDDCCYGGARDSVGDWRDEVSGIC